MPPTYDTELEDENMNSSTDGAANEHEMTNTSLADSSTRIDNAPTEKTPLHKRAGLRQFVKFCMVGATSTVVDIVVLVILNKYFGLWWTLAKTFSFTCGVTNGFFWNNRWTFGHLERSNTRKRYMQFFAVNIVGFILSVCIMKTVFVIYYQTWQHPNPNLRILLTAQFIAIPIVVFWNFFANRKWTFKA